MTNPKASAEAARQIPAPMASPTIMELIARMIPIHPVSKTPPAASLATVDVLRSL
jgi:hypothetical protein